MTLFELSYLSLEPFLPPLHRLVRRELQARLRDLGDRPRLLDVGGRKSHVTIGVPADVTVTDLPRESDLQKRYSLGINADIADQTRRRRSNIQDIVLDDMTRSVLPSQSFDAIIAVEVLEHVEEDDAFVRNVARVLKPGGRFLMTTPNGDFIKNVSKDHKRHYKRSQLEALLAAHLDDVEVWYAVKHSESRLRGLHGWSPRHPVRTLSSMAGSWANYRESVVPGLAREAVGTCHLFASARARKSGETPA